LEPLAQKKLALGLLAAAFKSELLTYDVKTTKAIRSNMELDATPSLDSDATKADNVYTVEAKFGSFK